MRTYVKIQGKNKKKGVKALEKLAAGMPEVCIMDTLLDQIMPDVGETFWDQEWARTYFGLTEAVDAERCTRIVSKSGAELGEWDFYFEWFEEPEERQLGELEEKIGEALKPLGYKYTIENRK